MKELFTFVVEKAPEAQLDRRARIYRELATVIGRASDAARLLGLAAECEAVQRHCQQFTLDFGGHEGGQG